jgi:hypothetical protein
MCRKCPSPKQLQYKMGNMWLLQKQIATLNLDDKKDPNQKWDKLIYAIIGGGWDPIGLLLPC